MTATVVTTFPDPLPDTVSSRAILLGERLDTRGLEWRAPLSAAPLTLRLGEGGIAVLFRYGVAVLFNASSAAEETLLQRLAPFVSDPLHPRESDDARIRVRDGADEGIDVEGAILLKESNTERFQLVADVLAKSLILAHYETRIAGIFDRVEPLAASLRSTGSAGAAGRDLLRHIGNVLLIQHNMVGRVETGEKPELLWDHPELERLHVRLSEEYELRERSRALDQKLDLIARTVGTLLDVMQSRRSLRVEWYIVALIVAEILVALYPLLLRG